MDHMTALRATYAYIESYQALHRIAPTEREIGKRFGITSTGAGYRVRKMEALGWLRREGIRAITLMGIPQGDPQGL